MRKFSLIGWVWKSTKFWRLISCCKLSSCQKKIDFIILPRDNKSNCMPIISLIGWVFNLALFWQPFSCYGLSSCHKKFTAEIYWGIANLNVCWKSVWLIELQILLYYDNLSVITSCLAVIKNVVLIKLVRGMRLVLCQIWVDYVVSKILFWVTGRQDSLVEKGKNVQAQLGWDWQKFAEKSSLTTAVLPLTARNCQCIRSCLTDWIVCQKKEDQRSRAPT